MAKATIDHLLLGSLETVEIEVGQNIEIEAEARRCLSCRGNDGVREKIETLQGGSVVAAVVVVVVGIVLKNSPDSWVVRTEGAQIVTMEECLSCQLSRGG